MIFSLQGNRGQEWRANRPEMARKFAALAQRNSHGKGMPRGILGPDMASGSESPCGNPWESKSILPPSRPSKQRIGKVDADSRSHFKVSCGAPCPGQRKTTEKRQCFNARRGRPAEHSACEGDSWIRQANGPEMARPMGKKLQGGPMGQKWRAQGARNCKEMAGQAGQWTRNGQEIGG